MEKTFLNFSQKINSGYAGSFFMNELQEYHLPYQRIKFVEKSKRDRLPNGIRRVPEGIATDT